MISPLTVAPIDADGSDLPLPPLRPITLLPPAIVAVLLCTVAFVFMHGVGLNLSAFVAVQDLTRALPDVVWSMITICGTGVVAFALLAPTMARHPRWYAAGLAAAAIAGAYSNGLKRLFALPRPASVLEAGHLHVIGDTLRANTFPSGHAVTAFTVASLLVLGSHKPWRTASWALPMALLIALSRIAVGAHWPADLAAGAAGGWVSGALGVMIVMRWRGWNTVGGVRTMACVSIGIGVSLFVVDLGYPLAEPMQHVAAVVAIATGLFVLRWPRLDPSLPRRADDEHVSSAAG